MLFCIIFLKPNMGTARNIPASKKNGNDHAAGEPSAVNDAVIYKLYREGTYIWYFFTCSKKGTGKRLLY